MQTAFYEYADGTILEFATRGEHTNDEGGQRIGNLFYGSKGWLWIDETGRRWQSYMGALGVKNEKGPGADTPPEAGAEPVGLTTTEFPHYQNFIDAIRANDPKKLTCDIMEGHLSSALPHFANISYRVGHSLVFDGKVGTVRRRQEGGRAADARVPQGLRDSKVVLVGARAHGQDVHERG